MMDDLKRSPPDAKLFCRALPSFFWKELMSDLKDLKYEKLRTWPRTRGGRAGLRSTANESA